MYYNPPHHRNEGNADPTYNFGCQIDDVRCKDAIPYGSGRTLLAFALVYFHIMSILELSFEKLIWHSEMTPSSRGNTSMIIYGCCAPSSLYCFQRRISTNTWESGTINSIWTTDMVVLCFHSIQSFWSLCPGRFFDFCPFYPFAALMSQSSSRLGIRKQNQDVLQNTWFSDSCWMV